MDEVRFVGYVAFVTCVDAFVPKIFRGLLRKFEQNIIKKEADVDSCLIDAALHTCGAQDIIWNKGYAPGIPGYSHRIVRDRPLPFGAYTVLLGEVCNVGSIRIAK